MADLSDQELVWIASNAADRYADETPKSEVSRAVAELQRRRAEQAAGREHVERVVREAVHEMAGMGQWPPHPELCDAIARRVADRLSAPVLSANDIEMLTSLRRGLPKEGHPVLALLDRLIAGAKP